MTPEFFVPEEGCMWEPWTGPSVHAQELERLREVKASAQTRVFIGGIQVHALYFPNGRVWDVVNGWRNNPHSRPSGTPALEYDTIQQPHWRDCLDPEPERAENDRLLDQIWKEAIAAPIFVGVDPAKSDDAADAAGVFGIDPGKPGCDDDQQEADCAPAHIPPAPPSTPPAPRFPPAGSGVTHIFARCKHCRKITEFRESVSVLGQTRWFCKQCGLTHSAGSLS